MLREKTMLLAISRSFYHLMTISQVLQYLELISNYSTISTSIPPEAGDWDHRASTVCHGSQAKLVNTMVLRARRVFWEEKQFARAIDRPFFDIDTSSIISHTVTTRSVVSSLLCTVYIYYSDMFAL